MAVTRETLTEHFNNGSPLLTRRHDVYEVVQALLRQRHLFAEVVVDNTTTSLDLLQSLSTSYGLDFDGSIEGWNQEWGLIAEYLPYGLGLIIRETLGERFRESDEFLRSLIQAGEIEIVLYVPDESVKLPTEIGMTSPVSFDKYF